ncbi:MAG: glycoside hydrolase [Actinomycetota bacterium]|nr:glycoside hydrolase [Actinomycetota bacterium]
MSTPEGPADSATTTAVRPEPAQEPRPGGGDPRRARLLWLLLGAALVLLGAGAIVVSTAFDTDPEGKALGGNLPINPGARDPADTSSHNSPTLVRNPRDEANLAVANRIDTPRFSCALQVSFDGGAHWSQIAVPVPPGEKLCYAPDATFGADGTLYYSFVSLRGRANAPNAVWLVTSRDGGQTLSNPVRIGPLPPLSFHVRLVADPTTPRRLYVTWLEARDVALYKFTQPGNPIRSARSDDGGATWRATGRVSSPARQRAIAPSPAVGPDGELYVLYLDLGNDVLDYEGAHQGRGGPPAADPWQLVLARSRDRGATWRESVVEDRLVPPERFVVFTPPFPSLAVDRDTGRVYAGFYDQRLGDADVWVWSLPGGGDRWAGPTRVNDTPQRDRTSQYLPRLSVAPDGRLDVVYYDRRADRANVMNEVSLQSSFDQGTTFTPRIRMSDRSFDSRIGYGRERNLPDLGSRLGLVSTDRRALAVWSDTRAGTPTAPAPAGPKAAARAGKKQDLARAVVVFSDPPRLSGPVTWLLRVGGAALILAGLAVLATRALAAGRGGRRLIPG